MSDTEIIDVEEEPKKPSIIVRLILPLILILAAGGAGFGFAKGYVAPMLAQDSAMNAAMVAGKEKAAMEKEADEANSEEMVGEPGSSSIIDLEAVVTNLAEPSDVWVSAELSLMFTEPPEVGMPETIQEDFVSHLRTIKLRNLQGSSGFQHLIADLNDLAMLRSENKVSRVHVRAFLVE